MRTPCCIALGLLMVGVPGSVFAQLTPVELVQRAVDTEIEANRTDHTPWLYLQDYHAPGNILKQWVAETHQGDVKRVIEKNGVKLSDEEQRQQVQQFIADAAARDKQRKNGAHDDQQAENMLKLLPKAFVWTETTRSPHTTSLHFRPAPAYSAPTYEARVFAAMEGDMTIDNEQFRITSLKGRLVHDVTFGFGVFGRLREGGSFAMERKEVAPKKWLITATHIHMQGRALLFKNISEEEDDVRTDFRMQPDNITLQQAADEVLSRRELVASR